MNVEGIYVSDRHQDLMQDVPELAFNLTKIEEQNGIASILEENAA